MVYITRFILHASEKRVIAKKLSALRVLDMTAIIRSITLIRSSKDPRYIGRDLSDRLQVAHSKSPVLNEQRGKKTDLIESKYWQIGLLVLNEISYTACCHHFPKRNVSRSSPIFVLVFLSFFSILRLDSVYDHLLAP